MRVLCPRCQHPVEGKDIDLTASRALCRPCGELFALPVVPPVPFVPSVTVRDVKALVVDSTHRPADLRWSESLEGTRATFVLAPTRLAAIPLLAFATVWDGFLVLMYSAMLRSPKTALPTLLFPLLHVAAGVYITWLGLSRLLNTTRIAFTDGRLVVSQGPIPGRGLKLPLENIDAFDVVESRGSKGRVTWRVRVLTRDGRALRVPLPVDGVEQAGFATARLNVALASVREPRGYRG